MTEKKCSKCKVIKPVADFHRDNSKGRGIRCHCKECDKKKTMLWREKNRSEYNNYTAMWRAKNPDRQHAMEIKRRYKLSIEEYNVMLTAQACKCKICGKDHDPSQKRGRLYVDHSHKTEKIRGLLCGACNSAIGYLEDDHERMAKAIAYLKS